MFKHRPNLFALRGVIVAACLALLAGCGGGGNSSAAATPVGIPPAPAGLAATSGNAQVSLTWSASSGATSYNVKRSTASGGPYTQLASVTSPSYTDATVSNGTTYYYVVSAVNSGGESANSAQASVTPAAPTVPPAPTNLQATAGNAQASLAWSASGGATSYHVKRGTTSGGPYTQVGAPTSSSYTDSSLTNGTTYYYVVSALDSAGESANSAQVNVVPMAPIVGNGPSHIVQSAVADPNPGKFDSYSNGDASVNQNLSFSVTFPGNTTSGNTLLVIATVAYDAADTILSVSDPVNGAWTSVGDQLNTTDCNCDVHPFVIFNASPLLTKSWTGTGAVAAGILTIGSGSGPFRIGQRIASAHTPVQTAAGGDVVVLSLLSGSLGAPGSTYQLNNAIGSTTFASETMTTTDFVAVKMHFAPTPDYPGAYLAEISGTDGSSVYFSGHNDAPTSAGTDTVTSGTMAVPLSPGIVFGFGFNGGINNSKPFPPLYAPNAGSGFTHSTPILQYDQGNPICTIEWQNFSSVGTRAATFSPTADSRYATVAVGFLDAP